MKYLATHPKAVVVYSTLRYMEDIVMKAPEPNKTVDSVLAFLTGMALGLLSSKTPEATEAADYIQDVLLNTKNGGDLYKVLLSELPNITHMSQ